MNKKMLLLSAVILLCFTTIAQGNVQIDSTWWMNPGVNQIETDIQVDLNTALNLNLGIQALGRLERPNEFATAVTNLGLQYQLSPKYKVFGGTRNHTFGRARLHSVFLSPQGPPFPMLGYEITTDKYNYTKIYGDLTIYGSTAQQNKRVGLHYFDWRPHPRISLGLGEGYVRDATFRADMYYDVLPFVPYYLAKFLPGVASAADNALVYGDFEVRLDPVTIYGELLVNEFPMTIKYDNNPPLFGLTLGAETRQLLPNWIALVEYSHVRNYAYANGNLNTTYSFGEHSLGHPYGDDVETLDLQLSRFWPSLQIETTIGGFYRALGENRDLAKWYDNLEHRKESAFLDGVVERTVGTKLGITWVSPNFTTGFDIEVGHATNHENQLEKEGLNYKAVAKITWRNI